MITTYNKNLKKCMRVTISKAAKTNISEVEEHLNVFIVLYTCITNNYICPCY